MKKFTFLIALVAMMGLNVSCTDRGDRDLIEREEAPVEEMREGLEEGSEELEDSVD